MKIKSKLILTFLSVSLISLTISNSIFYYIEKENAAYETLKHLKSIASIKRARIIDLYNQNKEQLSLVASRTQLRISLDKFNKNNKKIHQEKMNRIIDDARKSINDFYSIHIIDLNGTVVASTDRIKIGTSNVDSEEYSSGKIKIKMRVDMFEFDQNNRLIVKFSGPLILKNRLLGVLIIESSVASMMSAIRNYTGLGKTGETILAKKTVKVIMFFYYLHVLIVILH